MNRRCQIAVMSSFLLIGCQSEKKIQADANRQRIQDANQAIVAGNYQKAKDTFIAVTTRDPANDEAHIGLARAYFLEGQEAGKKSLETGKAGGKHVYVFSRTRTCYSQAAKSLRRVNPSNHLAKSEADNILLDIQLQLKQLAQLDGMGEAID